MSSPEQTALLPRLPRLTQLLLRGGKDIPSVVLEHTALEHLALVDHDRISDLSSLRRLPHLSELMLQRCRSVTRLEALACLPLSHLYLYEPPEPLSLAPLNDLPTLRHLVFDFPAPEASVGDLAFAPQLTGLGFFKGAAAMRLSGIEALTELQWLTVNEDHQWLALRAAGVCSPLRTLQILDVSRVDIADLLPHQGLAHVYLGKVRQVDHIAALAELPELAHVEFSRSGPVDLTPLAALDGVTVRVHDCPDAVGVELFPRDRLTVG